MFERRDSRILRTIPILIAVCLVSFPGHAKEASGGGERTAVGGTTTCTYEFVPAQSTLVQTRGIAGDRRTYVIEGWFQLSVDPIQHIASFVRVHASARATNPPGPSLDLSDVLSFTDLVGTVLVDGSIRFEGKADDGSDILMTLTFEVGLAYLKGNTTPPAGHADAFVYSLDAVATTPTSSTAYEFIRGQSVLVQTGGIGGIPATYFIEGDFGLSVDTCSSRAGFAWVQGSAMEDSLKYHVDLNRLCDWTALVGTILAEGSIQFIGTAYDGSSVVIAMTFQDDLVYLTGETTPPVGGADLFAYSLHAVAQRKYGGGFGEGDYPYLIYTAEQMNAIGAHPTDWDKHFKLMADIDLSAFDGKEGRPAFNIIGTGASNAFTGVFDGSGHTISNFTYSCTDRDFIGLFGHLESLENSTSEIRNLGLINCVVDAGSGSYVGALVGYDDGDISNCYSTGAVSGTGQGSRYVGGLVGVVGGAVTNCYSTARVIGDRYVGGLVGVAVAGGTVTDCHSKGAVDGSSGVGGLAGQNSGTVTTCHSTGAVNSTGVSTSSVGGLVGDNSWRGSIDTCYSTGSVSGDWHDVGGLVGSNGSWDAPGGSVTNCYSTGVVTGGVGDVGGLVGHNWGNVTQCYSTAVVKGALCVGVLVGSNQGDVTDCHSVGHFSGGESLGGLVGWNSGNIMKCYSRSGGGGNSSIGALVGENRDSGAVTMCYSAGSIDGWDSIGGLVGKNVASATVTDCYSTAKVTGRGEHIGGLVGLNAAAVTQCYSTGAVSGPYDAGGLVGQNWHGTVTQCFWDVDTSGLHNMCGIQTDAIGCDDSFGKTTVEMQTESTFTKAGWDFVSIWRMPENDYPHLRWEPAGDPNEPAGQ